MIEIYLFINPLDAHSLKSEYKFLNVISNEKEKIHFRLIPILNPRVVQNYLVQHNLPTDDLVFRNNVFNAIYSACLDYKAIQLQGKQLGKRFLFSLQEKVGIDKHNYSTQLVHSILKELNADIDLFNIDRKSELIVDFFHIDQQVANEMSIENYTDAVIFNYHCERDFGVLVDDTISTEMIMDLFKTDYHSKTCPFAIMDNQLHQ
ncbi:MAG: DsbA family protein [Vagococcus sp.]